MSNKVPDHLEQLAGMSYQRALEVLATIGYPDTDLSEDQHEALGMARRALKRQMWVARTQTMEIDPGATCWWVDGLCECGGPMATDGDQVWCVWCESD